MPKMHGLRKQDWRQVENDTHSPLVRAAIVIASLPRACTGFKDMLLDVKEVYGTPILAFGRFDLIAPDMVDYSIVFHDGEVDSVRL